MKYIKKTYKTCYSAMKDLHYSKKELEDAGSAVLDSVKLRFNKQYNKEVEGPQLKQNTIKRKRLKGRRSPELKLVDSGGLKRNLKVFVNNGNIRVGYGPGFYSSLAKWQQEGTKKIPARKFLFLNKRNINILLKHLIPKVK